MESENKTVLRAYFRWPFALGILLVLITAGLFFVSPQAGLIGLSVTAVYFVAAFIIYAVSRKDILKKLVEFGSSYAQVQNQLLRQVDIPFAMCNSEGDIFWSNPAFMDTFGLKKKETALMTIFPILENADFSKVSQYRVSFKDRSYLLTALKLDVDAAKELSELGDTVHKDLYNIFLTDETELLVYKQKAEEEKAAFALVYFDNYDEVMSSIEDVRRSLLSALLERNLSKYVVSMGGVSRKLEKDRFLVVMKQESLWKMEEDGFSILEDIKTVSIGNEMAVTISMGIGLGGESYEKNYENARMAIDMALGRGGDQAVVKNAGETRYFGGKSQSTEHITRVRARIKANALREIMESRDTVLIMGHPVSDHDSLGAAVGVYIAARHLGKRVHIVMENPFETVRKLMNRFIESPEYEKDLFIGREEALSVADKNTLLVVVDTNKKNYVECPELFEKTSQVVVIDHHRQSDAKIENAVLSYVEPYASSACEMVAEIVQYFSDGLKPRPLEADAMYAGIVIDTHNFVDKAGVRTFEAAAYLRRCGADAVRLRKLFRDSMEDYMIRAEAIRSAEMYKDHYMISVCPSHPENPNLPQIAAQAANELLEINGVKASFVLTEFENKVYVSARSIDEINVQIIMEQLGGGGHMSSAGTQFTDITVEEAIEKLKAILAS